MSSNKTLQSGGRPSQAIKDTTKRRTALLKDNSWIKRDTQEDEPVDADPNYGKTLLKTQNNDSKPAEATFTSPATAKASVSSPTKSTITTPKSPVTVAPSLTPTTPNKPPVPAKNPVLTTAPKSFTARVFSGANTSEKTFNPVKRSVDEQSPVSKEPPKEVINGIKSESKLITPPSPTVTSVSQNTNLSSPEKIQSSTAIKTETSSKNYKQSNGTTAPKSTTTITTTTTTFNQATNDVKAPSQTTNFSSPEKTQSSTAIKTETSLKNYEQSNVTTAPKSTTAITTTTTTFNQATSNVKAPSKTLDTPADILIPSLSPTVHTNPVSMAQSYKENPNTSQTLRSLPVNSPPVTQLSTRIVGKRDLCSFCGKNIVGGERMILDDLQIFSHTSCFKCELCYRSLGSLEAGATLWVHRGKVNCENCYKKTKDQWFH